MRVRLTENIYNTPVQFVLCTSQVWMPIFTEKVMRDILQSPLLHISGDVIFFNRLIS